MKKIILILTISLLSNLYSQDNTSDKKIVRLSLKDSINLSLTKNLNIKNNKIDLDNYLLSLQTVWNQFMPGGSFGFSFRDNLIDNKLSFSISLNTSLNLNPSSFFNIVKVINEYKQGSINYEIALKKFIIEVKRYYYNLIIFKKNIELKEIELNNAKIFYNVSVSKYNDGIISIVDKMRSEYNLSEKEIELKKAKNNFEIALIVFKNIIGVEDNIDLELIENFQDINIGDDIKNSSLNNNLDIKKYEYDLKNIINTKNTIIASFFPSFNFSYSFSMPFDNLYNYSSSFGISVSLLLDNLLPFSTNQVNLIKNNRNIEKMNNSIEIEKKNKEIELKKILKEIENQKKIIDSYVISLEIAKKSYDIIEKSYLSGATNFYDLKEAEKDLDNAMIKILQAKYDYISKIFDLEYLLNIEIIK